MNLYIEPTDLRKDITYIIITNWIRFIILGFVPVTLLVMLYANIHTNLKKRKKRANGKYLIFHFYYIFYIEHKVDFERKLYYIFLHEVPDIFC